MSIKTFEMKMVDIAKNLEHMSLEDFQIAINDAVATEIDNQPNANFIECRACGWDTDDMNVERCQKCNTYSFVKLHDVTREEYNGAD